MPSGGTAGLHSDRSPHSSLGISCPVQLNPTSNLRGRSPLCWPQGREVEAALPGRKAAHLPRGGLGAGAHTWSHSHIRRQGAGLASPSLRPHQPQELPASQACEGHGSATSNRSLLSQAVVQPALKLPSPCPGSPSTVCGALSQHQKKTPAGVRGDHSVSATAAPQPHSVLSSWADATEGTRDSRAGSEASLRGSFRNASH